MAADPLSMSAASQEVIHRDQRAVQLLLRVGLGLAVALMAIGLGLKVASGSHRSSGIELFALTSGSTADLVMALGVLVLAATPLFRVLALVVLWTRERDWRFVGVALLVVVTLSMAIVLGHG